MSSPSAHKPTLLQALEEASDLRPDHGSFLLHLLSPLHCPADSPLDLTKSSLPPHTADLIRTPEVKRFISLFEKLEAAPQRAVLEALNAMTATPNHFLSTLPQGMTARASTLIRDRFSKDEPKSGSVLLAIAVLYERMGGTASTFPTSRIAEIIREATKGLPNVSTLDIKLGPFIRSMTEKHIPEVRRVRRGDKGEWQIEITEAGAEKLQELLAHSPEPEPEETRANQRK